MFDIAMLKSFGTKMTNTEMPTIKLNKSKDQHTKTYANRWIAGWTYPFA